MMQRPDAPIGVIGAGAWGTALANAAAETGRRVLLWGHDPDHVAALAETRTNARHLPGMALHADVEPVASLARAASSGLLLVVVPTQALRGVSEALSLLVEPGVPLVVCAKGIERGTGLFASEVAADLVRQAPVAVLSGPSFAADVARGLPTAVTLAARREDMAEALAQTLSTQTFRIYHSTDLRGVEIGGAAKNVLAIAAGVVIGLGLGESARAALIARGFAELTRFARANGGRAETLMGLSGLGDLVLTCGSAKSRNFAYGHALGEGIAPERAAGGKLAEGAFTASALREMAVARGVDMPIVAAVDDVIAGRITVREAASALMARPVRSET